MNSRAIGEAYTRILKVERSAPNLQLFSAITATSSTLKKSLRSGSVENAANDIGESCRIQASVTISDRSIDAESKACPP
ncbi:unnamed protein product [Anisakis simplex]|uniref:Uncharacterized protein n=1 Tax=Anisakis simplex TaxID=6269 RepID=A0A0M3KAU2_ANISI|nr:unnamed protein product [Anisakis simplex]